MNQQFFSIRLPVLLFLLFPLAGCGNSVSNPQALHHVRKAAFALGQQDPSTARRHFELALMFQPENVDALAGLGAILFLEDVGEATYRLDRMLTQLWLAGALQKCAGIVFGKFSGCTTSASWAKQFTVEEVLVDRCSTLGIPVLRGLMIGHIDDQTTLPVDCLAELDAEAGTLRLLEPGVQ